MAIKLRVSISQVKSGLSFTCNGANGKDVIAMGIIDRLYSLLDRHLKHVEGITLVEPHNSVGSTWAFTAKGDVDTILDAIHRIAKENYNFDYPTLDWLGDNLAKGVMLVQANTSVLKFTSLLTSLGYSGDNFYDYTKEVQPDKVLDEIEDLKSIFTSESIKHNYQAEKYQSKSKNSLLNITLQPGLIYYTYYIGGKMKITNKKQEQTTASVFEDADFVKGDRVIINVGTIKEPECYLATVIQVSAKKKLVRIEYDDGYKEALPIDNRGTGIIGYCNHKRKIKREIPIDKVDDMIDTDQWYSSSIADVNKPGFTLKRFTGKTPKVAKKMAVPNKIIKSEKSVDDLPILDVVVAQFKRIFADYQHSKVERGRSSLGNAVSRKASQHFWLGGSDTKRFGYYVTEGKSLDAKSEPILRVFFSSPNPIVKKLSKFGKIGSNKDNGSFSNYGNDELYIRTSSYKDWEEILSLLESVKSAKVEQQIEQQKDVQKMAEKISTENIKKVEKERLVEVQTKLLDKSLGQLEMYHQIQKSELPPIQRVWYATEDNDLIFDFTGFQICQSTLDGAWYLVEKVGTGIKQGHKFYEETKSAKKVLKQALDLAKKVTASLNEVEINDEYWAQYADRFDNRITRDYINESAEKVNIFNGDDLSMYSYQEVDSRLNPKELTNVNTPRYVFSIYNQALAKEVIKKDKDPYLRPLVHHYYASSNPSLPSAFTEALYSYALSLSYGNSSSTSELYKLGYDYNIEKTYQALLEQYSENSLLVQVAYL